QQLLQPPLAEVRCRLLCPPARVSASLGAGSEAAPPSPRPPRVLPKRERQRPGSPLGEAASAHARPLTCTRAPLDPVAPRRLERHGAARGEWRGHARPGERPKGRGGAELGRRGRLGAA
ncbi:hypothetical protein P7K49_029277, partial [Saguinus oedipus]